MKASATRMSNDPLDIVKHNREAWDGLVRTGNRWTQPVTTEQIQAARNGDWHVVLTPQKPVPREWFGDLKGARVLCLAGGGGQQGPILAAAGAKVTIFDNSSGQLHQDQLVAARDGLEIETIQGDMRDLSVFADGVFDLVFHPCSNSFVPDIQPVWNESFRVLRSGGRLLSGFVCPLFYIFDYWEMEKGNLTVKYSIPFADDEHLEPEQLQKLIDDGEPLCYGHSLEDQIGGQLVAGFQMTGLFEDDWDDEPGNLLSRFIKPIMATMCVKPQTT